MLSIDRHAIVEMSSVGCSGRSNMAEGLLLGVVGCCWHHCNTCCKMSGSQAFLLQLMVVLLCIWCKTKEEKAATIIWWYIWWYTRLYCQYIMVKACFPLFPCLCLGQMYMPENSAFTWVIEVNIEQSVFLTVPAFHLDMSWSNVSAIKGALLSV